MTRPHVVIVGAGLAGLSAAIRAIDCGLRVTLLEGRPRFGGATWSFDRKGLMFDNGQHVYLGCCTAYRGFLERIGSSEKAPLRRLAIPVLQPRRGGSPATVAWIRRNSLPAPLHLAGSLARYRYLSLAERANIGRAALALRKLDLDDARLDEETFESFLVRHGQSQRSVDVLWDLITLPTVNVHAREASLFLAAKVFQTGLLGKNDAADIGWSEVPLTELHANPTLAVLRAARADVRSRARVSRVVVDEAADRVCGVDIDGETLEADAVILAVNPEEAVHLLPPRAQVDIEKVEQLGASPIIDVHVVFDRMVMHHEIAAGIDSPVQYVFDRTSAAGLSRDAGQCLAISVSGADEEHGERPEVLIDRYTRALGELFPIARSAKVIDAVVSREHRATFRAVPGTNQLRPGVTTGLRNLFLAGTYTDTGWPATMESAVLSGQRAVDHVVEAFEAGVIGRDHSSQREAIA